MFDIEKELALYKLREIENEDLKLKIEEIKLGDNFGSMTYEERVQTSMSCKNNDKDMNEIDSLEKRIKINTIKNKRVDNLLKLLNQDELEVVEAICINKISKTQAQIKLNMSRKNVIRKLNQAIEKMKHYKSA